MVCGVAGIGIPGLMKTAPRRAVPRHQTTHNTFMNKRTKSATSTKSTEPILTDEQLITALDQLFGAGKWEIPDDAVSGKVAAQVSQLQSRVDHLTDEVARLTAEKTGAPVPRRRINALSDADEPMEKGNGKSTKTTARR